jgi:hypothetical protein
VIIGRKGVIMKLWRRLRRNAAPLTALFAIIQTVIVGGSLIYAARTISESNRIAWRTFLDTRASEIGRKLLEYEAMRCIYPYSLKSIDVECLAKVYDKKNITQLITFTEIQIDALREVKKYDQEFDPGYFKEWYGREVSELSKDPSGIISYVLYNIYSCESNEKCADKINEKTGICIGNDDGRCLENLLKSRSRFIETVNAQTN